MSQLDWALTILCLVLVALAVLQFIVYNLNEQKLINKLMSRNFYEYQTAKVAGEEKEKSSNTIPDFNIRETPQGQADEVNSLLGF